MLKKILLYYHTLKYLKPVQIYGRIFALIKKRIPRNYHISNNLKTNLTPKTNFIHHDPWNSKENILKGGFTFLNDSATLNFPPKWEPDKNLLWKFNLHYFHYLFLLDESEKIKLLHDWIDKNPVGKGTSWHPYVISLRLINWIREDFNDQKIVDSIYQQSSYLYNNLENYHPANHYVENLKSLFISGLNFYGSGDSNKWLNFAKKELLKTLDYQILNDGAYFELTPAYHAKILEGVLDILNVYNEEDSFSDQLKEYAKKMLLHLQAVTHPDGNLALFNDTTQEIVPKTEIIYDYFNRLGLNTNPQPPSPNPKFLSFPSSGFYTYNSPKLYFITKAGKIGPDEIPAHAHADLFSYELSVNGEQFVVDTGVYEYTNGEKRDFSRSTKAHNTVTIDEVDQSQMWGGFRVGKRYEAENVTANEKNDRLSLSGEFKGYLKLVGDNLKHKREFTILENDDSIRIKDEVTGNGKHMIESYIHLHPDVLIEKTNNGLLLSRNKTKIKLSSETKMIVKNSSHFPKFGREVPNQTIVLRKNVLPTDISYSFLILGSCSEKE